MHQTMNQITHQARRHEPLRIVGRGADEDDAVPRRGVTDTKARMAMVTTELCRRCRFHPVSPRIGGYCSWDCHDSDDEEELVDPPGADDRAA